MSESEEKNLISAFSTSWNEVAPPLLGCPSTLTLLASREVSRVGMNAALALAMTWPWAFAASCPESVGGVLICLFKNEEGEEIDRLVKPEVDGIPKPGGRQLMTGVLESAASKLEVAESGNVAFGPVAYIDLTIDKNRLSAIVGDSAEIGTFTLSMGEEINSQMLMLYAPNGSLDIASGSSEADISTASRLPGATQTDSGEANDDSLAPEGRPGSNGEQRRIDAGPRNLERLLEVELDVVVRFGVTHVPLRDVVRMGVGTMIELNRAVDEPVELLVNGRQLARGEVVVVDGYYGVRITEISPFSDRASML